MNWSWMISELGEECHRHALGVVCEMTVLRRMTLWGQTSMLFLCLLVSSTGLCDAVDGTTASVLPDTTTMMVLGSTLEFTEMTLEEITSASSALEVDTTPSALTTVQGLMTTGAGTNSKETRKVSLHCHRSFVLSALVVGI